MILTIQHLYIKKETIPTTYKYYKTFIIWAPRWLDRMVLSSLSFQKLKNIIILNCFKMGSSNLPSHHTITFFFEKTTLKIRNIDPVSKVLYNYIKQAQRTPIPGTKICGSYSVVPCGVWILINQRWRKRRDAQSTRP